jgi:hypothetical protein
MLNPIIRKGTYTLKTIDEYVHTQTISISISISISQLSTNVEISFIEKNVTIKGSWVFNQTLLMIIIIKKCFFLLTNVIMIILHL